MHRHPSPHARSRLQRTRLAACLALALGSLGLQAAATAATFTWGGSPFVPGANWSSQGFLSSNWVGLGALPVDGDSLVFASSNKLVNQNDLLGTVGNLSFAAGAGGFTIQGRLFSINGTLSNASSNLQVINNPLAAGASAAVWDGGAGGVQLNSGLLLLGSRTLELTNRIAVSGGALVVGTGGTASLTLSGRSTVSSTTGALGNDSWADRGSVTVGGIGSDWTVAGGLQVGKLGQGTLELRQGGTVSAGKLTLGDEATASGIVRVQGSGSTLRAGGLVDIFDPSGKVIVIGNRGVGGVIGNRGAGLLEIRQGGRVVAVNDAMVAGLEAGGRGTVQVADSGSVFEGSLILGGYGTGTLSVRNGGRLVGALAVGFGEGSSGAATVDGQGSVLEANLKVGVGSSAVGTLGITGGAQSLSNVVTLDNARSWISVVGAGSLMDVTRNLPGSQAVLQLNAGEFSVLSGGFVRSNRVIGNNRMLVDGVGSGWTNTSDLIVGTDGGTGDLLIRNGGAVAAGAGSIGGWLERNDGLPEIGGGSLGKGSLTVTGSGSRWDSDVMYLGPSLEGTLNVLSGGTVVVARYLLAGERRQHKVDSAPTVGHILVDGAGSRLDVMEALDLGAEGIGDLTVSHQGQVNFRLLQMSMGRGGTSSLTLDGAGARLTGTDGRQFDGTTISSTMTAASELGSVASIRILNGGQASSTVGIIGRYGTASVMVDGPGSTLGLTGSLILADGSGSGTVELRRGGQLVTGTGVIGRYGYDGPGPGAYGNGRVTIDGAGSAWTVGGGVEVGPAGYGTLQLIRGGRLSAAGTLAVGSRGLVQLDGGTLQAQAVSLAGGRIDAPTGLDLGTAGPLSGFGAVNGRVVAGSRSITASGGALTLGDAAVAGAVTLAGVLNVGAQQVELRSADAITLGSKTLLGAGGRLLATHGLVLGSGGTLTASGGARLEADFVNEGQVRSSGGVLQLAGAVRGAGSFAGDIRFEEGHQPGNGAARIDFGGGNVIYAPGALLTMELLGPAPGSQHDQLAHIDLLSFQGRLQLVVGDSFLPAVGSRFQLFDFQRFSGLLDAGHIDVVGFDSTRLDFSRLSVDGSLGVMAPVPEPHTVALLMAGLGLVAWRARRRPAD